MVLIVLAAVWAAFLLPPILRARSGARPSGSISDFRRQLHVLARATPAGSTHIRAATPMLRPAGSRPIALATVDARVRAARRRRVVKRRRDVFVGLLAAMVGSLLLGFLPPLRVLWAVHVVLDVLFAGYVIALISLRNVAAEREMKVTFLPARSNPPEPALLYRRSAN